MTTQNLTCTICLQPWTRVVTRGRIPSRCPGCKDVQPARAEPLPPREQVVQPVAPVKRNSVLDRVLSVDTPYRVRMGSNLCLPGTYSLVHAHEIAKARAENELPPSEGGATYYVVREVVEGTYNG